MVNREVKTGDVFLAFNKNTVPPKMKYHLVINEQMSFLINSKPSAFSCYVTPEDCKIFTHECYIDCSRVRLEPYNLFKIIKIDELSKCAILRLIEKVKCSFGLTQIQIDIIVEDLNNCLKSK